MGHVTRLRSLVALTLIFAASCGGGGGDSTPDVVQPVAVTLSLALQPLEVTVVRGGQGSLTATATRRGNYSGGVTVSVNGAPSGVTPEVGSMSGSGDVVTVPITLRVATEVSAGRYTLSVVARAANASDAVASLTLIVTDPPGVVLSVDPQSITVFQSGAAVTSLVTLRRTAFTGSVSLSVEGTLPGLEAVLPSSTTLDAETVRVTASASVPAGPYTLTIRATPNGLPSSAVQTATLALTVRVPAPTNGNVTLDWSGCTAPTWIAFQDGAGPWTQVIPIDGIARFTVNASTGGFAFVEIPKNTTIVRYMTRDELIARPLQMCRTGRKTVTGRSITLGPTEVFYYNLGGGFGQTSGTNTDIVISGVRDGVHDLVAFGGALAVGAARGYIVRDEDHPDGSSIGTINWPTNPGFNRIPRSLSVTGAVAGEAVTHSMSYLTRAECTVNLLYGPMSGLALLGVPEVAQRPTDFHMLTVYATSASMVRQASVVNHLLSDQTVTLPPAVPTPLVQQLAGPFKRLVVTLGSVSAAYNSSTTLQYSDGLKTMSVSATAAYLAGGLTLAMPDLSGATEWPATTAIASANVTWTTTLEGRSNAALCTENNTTASVSVSGTG